MPQIKPLIGNKKNIGHLMQAANAGKLSHAYIINGAKGSGKKTLAAYIAASLICDNSKGIPCGTCAACIKAATKNHPDIIWSTHEKESVLKVDEVREQIIYDIYTPPYYGPYKIYIIQDAQLLNENGQNALLKTIEEPPEYALILLLTDNADGLLETIRSRCVRLDMEKLPKDVLTKELMKRGIEKAKAKDAASYAKGNLGLAIELVSESETATIREQITNSLKRIENTDAFEIFEAVQKYDKVTAKIALGDMLIWYRDILILKSTNNDSRLYNEKDKAVVKRQAEKLSFESINKIINAIKAADEKVKNSVKAEAVLESLLIEIRQEYK